MCSSVWKLEPLRQDGKSGLEFQKGGREWGVKEEKCIVFCFWFIYFSISDTRSSSMQKKPKKKKQTTNHTHPSPVLHASFAHKIITQLNHTPFRILYSAVFRLSSLESNGMQSTIHILQPTPVFLPGESQGQRSLVGCRLWDRTELDTTKVT